MILKTMFCCCTISKTVLFEIPLPSQLFNYNLIEQVVLKQKDLFNLTSLLLRECKIVFTWSYMSEKCTNMIGKPLKEIHTKFETIVFFLILKQESIFGAFN